MERVMETFARSGEHASCDGKKRRLLRSYFSELLIDVNLALRLLPRPFTAARMTIEIPAAMSPYSIAVAPDSSCQNFKPMFFMCCLYLPPNEERPLCASFSLET